MKLVYGDDFWTIVCCLRRIINFDIDLISKNEDNKRYLEFAINEANKMFDVIEEAFERIDVQKMDDDVFDLFNDNKKEAVKCVMRELLISCVYPYFELVNKNRERLNELQQYVRSKDYSLWGLLGEKEVGFCEYGILKKEIQVLNVADKYFPGLREEIETERYEGKENIYKQETVLPKQLVSALDELSEKENKYYERAIKCGFMEKVEAGFRWVNGGNVRLGYFCSKVYNNPRPINKLEDRFNVKKLSASISQAEYEAKRKDVIAWRNDIDNKIFFD